jgi:hypothetical protein
MRLAVYGQMRRKGGAFGIPDQAINGGVKVQQRLTVPGSTYAEAWIAGHISDCVVPVRCSALHAAW